MATVSKDEEAGLSPNAGESVPPPYQPDYGSSDNVPPAYEDSNPLDPPPSYDSIYGQMRAAKQESSGFVDFMKKFLVILVGSIGCTICVGIVLAVPISMIVIGSVYLYDCPMEKYIPIYLIVAGVVGVIKNLSNMVQRIRNKKEEQDDENAKTNPFDSILSCFLFAWFIAGNVWIYGHYKEFTDPGAQATCDATLYWFAFWMTTATYILMFVTCCCIICTGTVMGFSTK